MKKLFLFILSLLLPISSLLSQTLSDYISAVKGDTLVVKDYYEINNQPNSLLYAMMLDSVNVPANRVYELKTNGYYPLLLNPTTIRNTVIVGENNAILVNNKNETAHPPIICGYLDEYGASNTGGIYFGHNLTVKNCNIIPGSPDGSFGWSFFDGQADNIKLTLQNCLLEQTKWVFMTTRSKNLSWHIKDCYFVNMNDNFERRSGGVLHIFAPQDTLLVENSTHIMAQGYLYRYWDSPFKRIIFNHNTFVNCANVVFQDYGSQSATSVTNNIFVNCNVKPYIGIGHSIDPEEEDIDFLPVGIINVYPDMERKYLVDKNVVYWDPKLADIADILNSNLVSGSTNWVSQMITMNQRTQSLFDDNEGYPYLTEGEWFKELPDFTNSRNLLTQQVDTTKIYVLAVLDINHTGVALPDWRLINTDVLHSDFPIPVDLSYDNTDLVNGATGGFPLGDLNWFPSQKILWQAQKDAEYAYIQSSLEQGRPLDVKEFVTGIPGKFNLNQNFPNPFNPGTVISYELSEPGIITLSLYDMLGRMITTLVHEKQNAGIHEVNFNGSLLSSGIYFYSLTLNGSKLTRKMLLLK